MLGHILQLVRMQVSAADENLSAEAAMQRIWSGEAPGTGVVGLALARNQALAVGAQIEIEPQQRPSYQGTRISLCLPRDISRSPEEK